MRKYILKRTLVLIPTLIGVMIVLGIIFTAMPGNFADGFQDAKTRSKVIKMYHFDKPKSVQFLYWLKNFAKGDMGVYYSPYSMGDADPIAPIVNSAARSTFKLMLFSILAAVAIAVPLGVISVARSGTKVEKVIRVFSILGASIPNFVLAFFLFDAVRFNKTIIGYYLDCGLSTYLFDKFVRNTFVPFLALTIIFASQLIGYVYTYMLDVIDKQFITVVRCYGFKEKTVLYRYSLKNALVPIMTIIGTSFPALFSDVIVIQAAVGSSGLGSLLLGAVYSRQYNVIMAVLFITVLIVLISNYLLDMLYGVIDPRIKNGI